MTYAAGITRTRSLADFGELKRHGEPIVMVTAYDYPNARLAAAAGVDIVFVGDSGGQMLLGHDSTVPVSMEEMLLMTAAAARGAGDAFLMADMPFGSYHASNEEAVRNAVRLVQAGADAVKLEGGGAIVERAGAIAAAGIPVCGHLGLTPQTATLAGEFRAAARTAAEALRLFDDARALERAGCFMLVLETVRAPVADRITQELRIPVIGIGSGRCDGQVLVLHDLVGYTEEPPRRFAKRYAEAGAVIGGAIAQYAEEVRAHVFPDESNTYAMADEELAAFEAALDERDDQQRG
jgi:3-methyl-2-oxobutanoate hydroxymethyltransferase